MGLATLHVQPTDSAKETLEDSLEFSPLATPPPEEASARVEAGSIGPTEAYGLKLFHISVAFAQEEEASRSESECAPSMSPKGSRPKAAPKKAAKAGGGAGAGTQKRSSSQQMGKGGRSPKKRAQDLMLW